LKINGVLKTGLVYRQAILGLVLLFLLVPTELPALSALGVKGTLVVVVPNEEGLLVCADRRSYDPIRGDVDASVKIGKLNEWAAVASTGNTTYARRTDFSVDYDSNEEAEKFVAANGFAPSIAYWKLLASSFESDFNNYASLYPSWTPPNPPDHNCFRRFSSTSMTRRILMLLRFGFNSMEHWTLLIWRKLLSERASSLLAMLQFHWNYNMETIPDLTI
jgi:hypothetical protein